MPTIDLNDPEKSICITVGDPTVESNDPPILALLEALDTFHDALPIATVSMSGSGYTVTLKDARQYAVDIRAGNPATFHLASDDYWAKAEQAFLTLLGGTINSLVLMPNGMTSLEVSYAV